MCLNIAFAVSLPFCCFVVIFIHVTKALYFLFSVFNDPLSFSSVVLNWHEFVSFLFFSFLISRVSSWSKNHGIISNIWKKLRFDLWLNLWCVQECIPHADEKNVFCSCGQISLWVPSSSICLIIFKYDVSFNFFCWVNLFITL